MLSWERVDEELTHFCDPWILGDSPRTSGFFPSDLTGPTLDTCPRGTILEVLHRKEFVVPSSSKVPVNPTPYPEPKRERAKHYQLEAIAQMSVWGTSPGKMATVTGLSETYISRLLTDKRNKTFNKLRDEFKRKNLKNVVGPI